jgi:DNA-3-methyladenine glycosylase II
MPEFDYLKSHKKLYAFIEEHGKIALTKRTNVFLQLTRAIAGQQLSVKAAASIFEKFLILVGNKNPKPADIIKLSVEQMRKVGFSYSKAQYILNIAEFWIAEKVTDAKLNKLHNEEVIAYLTQIKGVGKWTVEMLLMFTLGRENIFTTGDLGIQQGMCLLYNWKDLNKKELESNMLTKAKDYSPYATYVCMYIWRYKDSHKQKKAATRNAK